MIDAPFTRPPAQVQAKSTENDITSQLNSHGNDNGDNHNKKWGDKMDGMPIKKKVPAANVFWTDHLRMLWVVLMGRRNREWGVEEEEEEVGGGERRGGGRKMKVEGE